MRTPTQTHTLAHVERGFQDLPALSYKYAQRASVIKTMWISQAFQVTSVRMSSGFCQNLTRFTPGFNMRLGWSDHRWSAEINRDRLFKHVYITYSLLYNCVRVFWWIKISEEQHLFGIEIFCNTVNVFTVTFDQLNAPMWIKVLILNGSVFSKWTSWWVDL